MKKMIFKYFIYNTLAVILLYGLYIILLLQLPDIEGMANEQTYFFILALLRNSFLSFYFIPVLIMLAVTYFLNLLQSIRKRSFLSFMTFAAIPLLLCLYSCFVALMLPINPFNMHKFMAVVMVIYTLVSILMYRKFRKAVSAYIH